MRVLVTVKAYPGVGRSVGEAVCVAGVRLDGASPSWVRLWPVGFRELPASARFRKWQIIELEARKSTSDLRPESYTPDMTTLTLGEVVPSKGDWLARRNLLGDLLGQTTLCQLMRVQDGSLPPSLGLVAVMPGATAEVVDGPVWSPEKELRADLAAAPHLLRDNELVPLRPPDYQVRYRWKCADRNCEGHTHSSFDWEVGASAYRWRTKYPDVRIPLLESFGSKMLGPGKDTHFFVGNQHQRPRSFLVLGAYYPKLSAEDQSRVDDRSPNTQSR